MPKQNEETVGNQEEASSPEAKETEVKKPKDNKAWFEAVMPSEEKLEEHNKTKDWYEASGLSEKDMNNVTNEKSAEGAHEDSNAWYEASGVPKEVSDKIKNDFEKEKSNISENEDEEKESSDEDTEKSEKESDKEGLITWESQAAKYVELWNKKFGQKFPLEKEDLAEKKVFPLMVKLNMMINGKRYDPEVLVERAIERKNKNLPKEQSIQQKELSEMIDKMRSENNIFHKYTHHAEDGTVYTNKPKEDA